MKIITNVLEDVTGIGMFYVAGLLLFVAFFIFMIYRMRKMPNEEAQHIKESILDDGVIAHDSKISGS